MKFENKNAATPIKTKINLQQLSLMKIMVKNVLYKRDVHYCLILYKRCLHIIYVYINKLLKSLNILQLI